jgi:type I restriction enzyme S subunit
MAGDWKPVELSYLVEIKHGFAFQGQYFKDDPPGPVLVTPGNFNIGGGFNDRNLRFYVGDVPPEFELTPGEVIVTMTDLSKAGDTLGYSALVPQDGRRYLHNQRIGKVVLRPGSPLSLPFANWLLRSPAYRSEVLGSATGSTVRHTSPTRIGAFRFALPDLDEQTAIASLLDALDEKIGSNRRKMETLKSTARSLFKSWFIDFTPVHAKVESRSTCLPDDLAALFPQSFDQDGLPTGWRQVTVQELCEAIFSGGTPSTTEPAYWGGPFPWLSSGETRSSFIIGAEKSITQVGVDGSSTRLARTKSVVIASAGQGHPRGQTSMLAIDTYINQSVVALRANREICSDEFLFFDLERRYEQFRQLSDGQSSRGSLTTKLLAGVEAVLPSSELIRAFDLLAKPIVNRIILLLQESLSLADLRDALLPKLISGEIRIADAQKRTAA